jgi:hypothetical protein
MGLKKIILLSGLGIPTIAVAFMNLFSGSAMNSLLPTPAAAADDHIKITREILLEGGTPVEPRVITQAHDGGYVIAGTNSRAWATRVDSEGKVQWRHEAHVTERRGGEYTGAAVLLDDSTILCGYQEVLTDTLHKTAGLLTHIDKAGRVIDERLIEPNDGKPHGFSHLNACVLVGDDVVVFGDSNGSERQWPVSFGWILTLDAKGKVKQEKFSPVTISHTTHPILRVMADRNIIFNTGISPSESGMLDAVRVVRLNTDGVIKAQTIIPGPAIQVVPTVPDTVIRLVPSSPRTGKIITLDAQLNLTGQLNGQVELIISKRAYYLPDRSLVLFGGQEYHGNSFTASIARISPDLSKKSVLIIEPALASDAIVDAVPTGVPGEFATIRSVSPMSEMGRSDTRLGVVLAFVQINK